MSFLNDLTKQAGGLAGLAAKNPQAMAAVVSLLNSRDSSVGETGGLGGLVGAFQKGDMVTSWISTGPNPAVSATQLESVLGGEVLKQFAAKAGVPHAEAGGLLASLLPAVIDHLTPQGQLPESNALESALGGLLSSFGR